MLKHNRQKEREGAAQQSGGGYLQFAGSVAPSHHGTVCLQEGTVMGTWLVLGPVGCALELVDPSHLQSPLRSRGALHDRQQALL